MDRSFGPHDPANPHEWVLAAPFRAHLRHLQTATGLPWETLARAAGVSEALVRHLVFGNDGRIPRRISPLTARRLVRLTSANLPQVMSFGPPPSDRAAPHALAG